MIWRPIQECKNILAWLFWVRFYRTNDGEGRVSFRLFGFEKAKEN
jgi:hypothetical protein